MIELDEQEKYVWLACADGWRRYAGVTATVDGVRVSIVLAPSESLFFYDLAFSDLSSGASLLKTSINLIDVVQCDTKEKTYAMFHEEAKALQARLKENGIENIKYKARCMKEELEAKFGPMPAIEIYEEVEE